MMNTRRLRTLAALAALALTAPLRSKHRCWPIPSCTPPSRA